MKYFLMETMKDTGRKRVFGLSYRAKYIAERKLSEILSSNPNRNIAIEVHATVAAMAAARDLHNEGLPLTAARYA